MRLLMQRVRWARVRVQEKTVAEIGPGMVVLVGVGKNDTEEDTRRCGRKAAALRIFRDRAGKMNLDIRQAGGCMLSVSQFTLYADIRKGNRPGFDPAALPEPAQRLWQLFNAEARRQGIRVSEGIFGAEMTVELCNDGPVTIVFDSRHAGGSQ